MKRRAAITLILMMIGSACGETTSATTTTTTPLTTTTALQPTSADIAAEVGAAVQTKCDETLATLSLSSWESVQALADLEDLGSTNPWIKVDGNSITINDAHICTDFFEPLKTTLGFSAATLGRMNNTSPLDGELTATGDGWTAYWTGGKKNGLDIIIEPS